MVCTEKEEMFDITFYWVIIDVAVSKQRDDSLKFTKDKQAYDLKTSK